MRSVAKNSRRAEVGASHLVRSIIFFALILCACSDVFAQQANTEHTTLSGHVLSALSSATRESGNASAQTNGDDLTITLTLRRDDEAGFQQYLHDVYDASSASFRHFLTPVQIADRFGPSSSAYQHIYDYFVAQGFSVIDTPVNRVTLSLRAARATVEQSFAVRVGNYRIADHHFYANDRDPVLPSDIAAGVQAVSGLSSFAVPHPVLDNLPDNPPDRALWYGLCANYAINGGPLNAGVTSGLFYATVFQKVVLAEYIVVLNILDSLINIAQASDLSNEGTGAQYAKCVNQYNKKYGYGLIGGGDPPPPAWQGADGTGQTIGLLEFDNYIASDVSDFVAFAGQSSGPATNVSRVDVNGGTTVGAGEDEVLLDIDDVLTAAPGAHIVVFDAPSSTSYQAMFSAMITHGVDIISNSWAYCEDQTTLADVQSIDAILQTAAGSGISVFSGAGDHGSTCLDGAANTASVPATSPHITAVGGTSLLQQPGFTYGAETWWDSSGSNPPGGQGGFGVSRFFARPAYQSTLTNAAGRSIPDVSADADPANGIMICQADAGGCPTYSLYGGTSSSAPTWAAFTAMLNQTQGNNLGLLNTQIYAYANTDAFHTAASMGSDFAHVGLGSPNLARLHMRLTGINPGTVSASVSLLRIYAQTTFSPLPTSSVPLTAFADGSNETFVVVTLVDANGIPVGGKLVTLDASAGAVARFSTSGMSDATAGTAAFYIKDETVETLTLKATDTTDGIVLTQTAQIQFVAPPSAAGSIVALTGTATADGQSSDTITVTLQDALGRPSPGKSVVLSQTGNAVITAPTPAITGSTGEISFTVTDTVQETVTFSAVDHSDDDLPVPGTASVTFNAGGGDGCGILNTGNPNVQAGPGFAMTPFATGFLPLNTNFGGLADGCRGSSGLAFDASGNLFVSDLHSGNVYKFGPDGGVAGPATLITPTPLGPGLESLTFGKDGKLYGAQNATTGNFFTGAVIEINPVSGALVRTVASSITCASFLATDPISGDLFVNDSCAGGGSENGSVWRISNPGGPTPTTTVYATTPGVNGGISIAPGGTLYMLSYHANGDTGGVVKIAGTSAPTPGQMTVVPGIIGPSLGVSATGSLPNGDAQSLILAAAPGTDEFPLGIRAFDVTTATASATALVVANAFADVQITGPDNCQYASLAVAVFKITNADGSCPLSFDGPSLALTPATIVPSPMQGTAHQFTATFHHAVVPQGTTVFFHIDGVNGALLKTSTDANGNATMTYSGVNAGTDTIVATATFNNGTITSNPATVTWNSGPHATFLSLDGGPSSGDAYKSATLSATLLDMTVAPFAPVTGATIQFSVNGQVCTSVTNANGVASCAVTIKAIGAFTLTASYAGDSNYLPSNDTTLFSTRDLIFADGFEGKF